MTAFLGHGCDLPMLCVQGRLTTSVEPLGEELCKSRIARGVYRCRDDTFELGARTQGEENPCSF
jgi:hypothetical protein